MAITAADVPDVYDVVLNGAGFQFDKSRTGASSDPLAEYTYSPTFVERSNVQGDYGDDQQSFWMTFSQKDWALGEHQRFYRSNDSDKMRRYWTGTKLDVTTTPGQATMRLDPDSDTTSTATSITALTYQQKTASFFAADSTTLFSFPDGGSALTSIGAHGAGAISAVTYDSGHYPLATDNKMVYIAGDSKIRKYNGSAFSDFSTTSTATSLAYLNNTLYSVGFTTGTLDRYDTAGVKTTLFTWKSATGAAIAPTQTFFLIPFGGRLAIVLDNELWLYDGTAPAKIADLPLGFRCYSAAVALGVIYLAGKAADPSGSGFIPTVYYYANGSIGQLWRSDSSSTFGWATVAPFSDGLMIYESGTRKFRLYTVATGGVHSVALASGTDAVGKQIAAGDTGCAVINKLSSPTRTGITFFPGGSIAAVSTLSTSLFDGESSLDKYFKAVKADFDVGGGTVDLAYQINGLDGSYTTAQTGATAGTEYTIGQTGRSISIKVTLNSGLSGVYPVLKRIYIRAAPFKQTLGLRTYALDLTGRDGKGHVSLNNGRTHPLDGYAQAQQLIASLGSIITITDRFGTFTGVIEPDGFVIREVRTEEYTAVVKVRQI